MLDLCSEIGTMQAEITSNGSIYEVELSHFVRATRHRNARNELFTCSAAEVALAVMRRWQSLVMQSASVSCASDMEYCASSRAMRIHTRHTWTQRGTYECTTHTHSRAEGAQAVLYTRTWEARRSARSLSTNCSLSSACARADASCFSSCVTRAERSSRSALRSSSYARHCTHTRIVTLARKVSMQGLSSTRALIM